jgi:hypothetical protein
VVLRRGGPGKPITLDSETAARLGIAMLAVSVVNKGPAQRPEIGTKIEGVHFPVTAWSVGRSKANGEPVLVVTLPGGSVLMLQLTNSSSLACGQALVQEARAAELPAGTKPN